MKQLEKALRKIEGYLLSIERNVMSGSYELTVGIPPNWVYKSNDSIDCETLHETDKGSMIKISSKEEDVVIDDLIEFVNIIIDTNKKIADMQEQLDQQLIDQKKKMEEFAQSFYEKIDQLKESSFEEMTKKQKDVGKSKKKVEEVETLAEPEEDDTLRKEVEERISK